MLDSTGRRGTLGSSPGRSAGRWISPSGFFLEELPIGMSLTGPVNLAEGPLLERIGDLRWSHITARTGVPSHEFRDASGRRVYPSFFYVDVAFPDDRPMASFTEGDRLLLADEVRRHGSAALDGRTYLLPEQSEGPRPADLAGRDDALEKGVPVIRTSNVFVASLEGAERLTKSAPARPSLEEIDGVDRAPETYATIRRVKKDGFVVRPDGRYLPLTGSGSQVRYQLRPDQDVNGAGLVYFARYPVILDMCERRVLRRGGFGLEPELLDRRTLIRRRSAYLRNASIRDSVTVETRAWIRKPERATNVRPGDAEIRLHLNYRMRRSSDGKLMMLSSARKVVQGADVSDLGNPDRLLSREPGEGETRDTSGLRPA